jgi:hypothetical protein
MPESKTLSASDLISGKKYTWGTGTTSHFFVGLNSRGRPVFDSSGGDYPIVVPGGALFYPVVTKVKKWVNVYYRPSFINSGMNLYESYDEAQKGICVGERKFATSIEIEVPESL